LSAESVLSRPIYQTLFKRGVGAALVAAQRRSLQTPRRILSLRSTRTQYSKDNEKEFHGVCNHLAARRFPPPWSTARGDSQSPKSVISRTRFSFGFFQFPSSRTLPRIEASARTINPTTHRLRTTVKNKKRNAIIEIYSISRMQTSEWN